VTRSELQASLARRLESTAEARWLLEDVLGPARPEARAPGRPPSAVPPEVVARAEALADRCREGEPLQYVLGHWAFRTLDLAVDPRVLIPRPETEEAVGIALALLDEVAPGRPDPVVVDLGTGSGAVALSLLVEAGPARPGLVVYALEADPGALAVARANARRLAAPHGTLRFCAGDWWDALPAGAGPVDLAVANPPYIAESEWAALAPEVRREPRRALLAGPGGDGTPGMAAIDRVVAGAPSRLTPTGALVVELAPHQARPAVRLARRCGFGQAEIRRDLAGRDRILVARR
jgi:release factor glutamine methyltransferase